MSDFFVSDAPQNFFVEPREFDDEPGEEAPAQTEIPWQHPASLPRDLPLVPGQLVPLDDLPLDDPPDADLPPDSPEIELTIFPAPDVAPFPAPFVPATAQPVSTMDPDQQQGYQAWLNAGGFGSPPAWVLEDRGAERRRAELAAAALAALAQTPLPIQNAFDQTGTGPIYAQPPIVPVDTPAAIVQTAVTTSNVNPAQFHDDTWRPIGGGRYMLIDAGGSIITFNQDGSDIQNIGVAIAAAQDVAANLFEDWQDAQYAPPVAPPPSNNNGTNNPPAWQSRFWDDTWRPIGGGRAMLVDQGGSIVTFDLNGGNIRYEGSANARAQDIAANLLQQWNAAHPANVPPPYVPPPPAVNPPGGNNAPAWQSPFWDDTHRAIGGGRFMLVDQGGSIITFDSAGGNIRNEGVADARAQDIAANRLQQWNAAHPSTNSGGGGSNNTDKGNSGMLIAGAIAVGAALWFANRKQ